MTDVVRNRDALATTDARATALACLAAAVDAAAPEHALHDAIAVTPDALHVDDATYPLPERVVVVGAGKPAARMAAALEAGWPADAPALSGVVVTDQPVPTEHVDVVEASHPTPDERGLAGAQQVRDAAADAAADTLVLALFGGGGSALLPAPAGDLALADLQAATDALLAAGAPIADVNAVRKHSSTLKGGRLARTAAPARVVTLLLSDVVGDDPETIASGPTVPDPTTYGDALAVLDRHDLALPAVCTHLAAGADGEHPETPTADDPIFDRVATHVLASTRTAVDAARETARDRGYDALVLSTRLRGEARGLGTTYAAVCEEVQASGDPLAPPCVVVGGGEATVTVDGDGTGGPNGELALAAAGETTAPGETTATDETTTGDGEWALLAADTDGRDGATDHAGALVDHTTVDDPGEAAAALAANDSHGYLRDRDVLLDTGRTGTNVNDLHVLVVERGFK